MIKAIETRYKGHRFRSRLEARWAVFFDVLGVPWDYEPEGFDLGPAGRYLPDFWLPTLGAWFEVKPAPIEPRGEAWAKAWALSGRDPVIVAGGSVGSHEVTLFCHDVTEGGGGMNSFEAELRWSDKLGLCLLVQAGKADRVLLSPHWEVLPWALNVWGIGHLPPDLKITRAISEARGARFEHGETPR